MGKHIKFIILSALGFIVFAGFICYGALNNTTRDAFLRTSPTKLKKIYVEDVPSPTSAAPIWTPVENTAVPKSTDISSDPGAKAPTEPSKKVPSSSGKVVYLTIDDGPSSGVTEKILDVLKEHDVKATFFVIGNQVKGKEEILKRAHEEGHSIGLHSFTHDVKRIYTSHDIFLNEMQQAANTVNNVIGISPKILRFPGGSRGQMNKELLGKLHELGYRTFDWTISSGDGMYPHNPVEAIFQNAVETQRLTDRAFLLMHDKPNNKNSIDALPKIIEFYRNAGYTFMPIDNDTAEYYFSFKQ